MTKALMLCCLLATTAVASEVMPLQTEGDAASFAEAAMERIVAGEYEAAFEALKSYWPMPEAEIDELATATASQRGNLVTRFGDSLGYELVRSETVGKVLLQLTYIEKTERHALRWIFLFYRPRDSWILNRVRWDDNTPALFGE